MLFNRTPTPTRSSEFFMFLRRKRLFTGTVPVNKKHLTGTVPVNKKHLTGTLFVHYTDVFDPGFAFFGQKK